MEEKLNFQVPPEGLELVILLHTLESGINIALRLLIFRLFSRGYGLILDSIELILVV